MAADGDVQVFVAFGCDQVGGNGAAQYIILRINLRIIALIINMPKITLIDYLRSVSNNYSTH